MQQAILKHRVQLGQVLGQAVMTGEQQARHQDKQDAKQWPGGVIQGETVTIGSNLRIMPVIDLFVSFRMRSADRSHHAPSSAR